MRGRRRQCSGRAPARIVRSPTHAPRRERQRDTCVRIGPLHTWGWLTGREAIVGTLVCGGQEYAVSEFTQRDGLPHLRSCLSNVAKPTVPAVLYDALSV